MGQGSKTRARARKLAKRRATRPTAGPQRPSGQAQTAEVVCLAPTPEQETKGVYKRARGAGRTEHVVNLASDMIGRLAVEGQITHEQEQAARAFQVIYSDWQAELPIKHPRSCLDTSGGGHDASDGDPEAIARYRALERRVGGTVVAILVNEVFKPWDGRPHIIGQLRMALERVAG